MSTLITVNLITDLRGYVSNNSPFPHIKPSSRKKLDLKIKKPEFSRNEKEDRSTSKSNKKDKLITYTYDKSSLEKYIEKDSLVKTRNRIKQIISGNPNYITNLIKSKNKGPKLKLKLNDINKLNKKSQSPTVDNGHSSYLDIQSNTHMQYMNTESNIQTKKADKGGIPWLKKAYPPKKPSILLTEDNHDKQTHVKRLLNIKTMFPSSVAVSIKNKDSNKSKISRSYLNSTLNKSKDFKKEEKNSFTKNKPTRVNSKPKLKNENTKNIVNGLSDKHKLENTNYSQIILDQVKNCIDEEMQGCFNFSYDEFHNLTSNRQSEIIN